MKNSEFWLVAGSQFLYGSEVLEIVDARAQEMAAELSRVLPYPPGCKVTAKTNQEITDAVKAADYDVTAEQTKDQATIMDIESVHISKDTTVEGLERQLFFERSGMETAVR
uniref:L-arabinose isomerase n=1 Tax=uncultured bacterium scaffold00056 TaxID=1132475 RepID=I7AI50_9BACT|nr:L-arabinose isomerase [uncultured bacterium scaffold00056]